MCHACARHTHTSLAVAKSRDPIDAAANFYPCFYRLHVPHHPHDSVALTTSAFELLSTRLPGCNSASHLGAQPSTARSEVSSEVSTCDDDPRVQSRVRLDTVLEFVTNLMAIADALCSSSSV